MVQNAKHTTYITLTARYTPEPAEHALLVETVSSRMPKINRTGASDILQGRVLYVRYINLTCFHRCSCRSRSCP